MHPNVSISSSQGSDGISTDFQECRKKNLIKGNGCFFGVVFFFLQEKVTWDERHILVVGSAHRLC